MKKLMLGLVLFAGWMAFAPDAGATTMISVGIDELALDSGAVVLARVGPADSILNATRQVVDTQLEIEEVWAGTAPDLLNIRQVGGTVGGRTVHVPGDGRLITGERVVAFIRKVDGRWYLTAMAQSVWHVSGDGPDAKVARDLHGLHLKERDSMGKTVPPTQSWLDPDTIEQLHARVETLEMGEPVTTP